MTNIFIQNRQHGKLGLITAASGRHSYDEESGDHYLTLFEGRRYEGGPGHSQFVIAEFGWNQNINFAALGMREKIERPRSPWSRRCM